MSHSHFLRKARKGVDRFSWSMLQDSPSDRGTTAFPTGLKYRTAWTMASSGPNGLEGVFFWLHANSLSDGEHEKRDAYIGWWESMWS
mgnify:CR=1 FL=1